MIKANQAAQHRRRPYDGPRCVDCNRPLLRRRAAATETDQERKLAGARRVDSDGVAVNPNGQRTNRCLDCTALMIRTQWAIEADIRAALKAGATKADILRMRWDRFGNRLPDAEVTP
jgi:NMD protein affecting ribosome stability and mRNA decay